MASHPPHVPRAARLWFAALLFLLLAAAGPRAFAQDAPESFGLLSRFPPDPVRFGVTIETGNLETARAWLDKGLDPDFMADRIGSGLMIGAWEGNIPMMELFLSRGANINQVNDHQEHALMHAAWKGHLDTVRWLLDHDALVDQPGLRWSALHYAAFAGNAEVLRLLMQRGANVNARAPNGSSVLMMAARQGHQGIAESLLAAGADPKLANEWGDDALSWAMRNGHFQIAKMVSEPERFAAAARKPPDPAKVKKSVPAPDPAQAVLRKMRELDAQGRLTDDLASSYYLELEEIRSAEGARAEGAPRFVQPKALEIRARRNAPGEEKAVLIYDDPYAQQPSRQAPRPAAPPAAPTVPGTRELPPLP